jgi:hypothetical protein
MKGQFESMGLAIIVLLVTMGIVLFVVFGNDKPLDAAERYEKEQLAQNTVDAMLSTHVGTQDCSLDFTDLIEDVALRGRNPCGNSLELMDDMATTILTKTLEERGEPYQFTVMEGDTMLYNKSTCDASTTENNKPGMQPIPLYPTGRVVEVTLWICL